MTHTAACRSLLIAILLLGLHTASARAYTVGIPCLERADCHIAEVEEFFTRAYARIGVEVEFAYLPNRRDLESVATGRTDASAFRTPYALADLGDACMVPFPLLASTLVAISANGTSPAESLDDLAGRHLGADRGDRICIRFARTHGAKTSLAPSAAAGIRMLHARRFDYFITPRATLQKSLQGADCADCTASKPLQRFLYYHILSPGNCALKDRLRDVFEQMHNDGTTAAIFQDIETELPTPEDIPVTPGHR